VLAENNGIGCGISCSACVDQRNYARFSVIRTATAISCPWVSSSTRYHAPRRYLIFEDFAITNRKAPPVLLWYVSNFNL
jgi:hypothetical protein